MNAQQLRAELRTKGPCFLRVHEIGTYITINKAALIDALTEFIGEDEDHLNVQVTRDGDSLFIEDFSPRWEMQP